MATSASPQQGIYYVQHSGRNTTLVVDEAGVVDITSGTLRTPAVLRQGFVNFSLGAAWEVSSADSLNALTSGTNPSFGRTNAGTDPQSRVRWASGTGSTDPIQISAMLPPDISTAAGLTVGVFGEGASANATNELDVRVYFGVGDANAGTTVALTSTPSIRTVAIASGDVIASAPITIAIAPNAHASGPIDLYGGIRLTYTRVTS